MGFEVHSHVFSAGKTDEERAAKNVCDDKHLFVAKSSKSSHPPLLQLHERIEVVHSCSAEVLIASEVDVDLIKRIKEC